MRFNEKRCKVFVLHQNKWNINKNNIFINTIVKLNENIIRLITTPINHDNTLRITAKNYVITNMFLPKN